MAITVGIRSAGSKSSRSFRCSLGRSNSDKTVVGRTYSRFPAAEQQGLPAEGHLVAAREWAEPDSSEEYSWSPFQGSLPRPFPRTDNGDSVSFADFA